MKEPKRVKKKINIEMGARLQSARENLGYTQENFAEILSISTEHYKRLEAGSSGVIPEKMKVLYEKVNIDPTYLITGEKKEDFDIDSFLASCSKEERNLLLKRLLAYVERVVIK